MNNDFGEKFQEDKNIFILGGMLMIFKNQISNKSFFYYVLGDIISGFGSGMTLIGLNWFILEKSNSSLSVAYFMILQLISGIVFSPFIGGLVDFLKRKDVLIISNFIRALAIILICIIYSLYSNYYILFILAIVNGAGWTTYVTSSRALTQEILNETELRVGNSFIEISMQVGLFLASGASGIIYSYIGIIGILAIDAATFIISNVFLYQIKVNEEININNEESYLDKIKIGKQYAIDNPLIFFFGVSIFIPFVVTMASNVILPEYVMNYLNSNSVVFGISDMLYGVGACLAGVIIVNSKLKKNLKVVPIYVYNIISIVALVFLYSNKIVYSLYIAYLVFGLGNTSLRILLNGYIMAVVPKKHFGYSMAIWLAISNAMQAIVVLSIGWGINLISANYGYLILALIMVIVLAILFYFLKEIKEMI